MTGMANELIAEKHSEEGETNVMASIPQKMTFDGGRRDTADDVEDEADRLMAELIDRSSTIRAVKVEEDGDDDVTDDSDDDYDEQLGDESGEETEEDSKVNIRKSAAPILSTSFDCKLCRRTFKKEAGLTRHMNALHPNGQVLRFKCEKCGKGFAKRHHMKNHEATHGPPSARCDLCPATFATKDTLVIHKARDHKMTMDNRPVSTSLPCSTCKQQFESQLQLRNHSYVCRRNLANKETKRVEKMSRLLQKRPKELKEKAPVTPCEKCGKAFRSQLGKSRHIRNHHPAYADQLQADRNAWRESLPHACELCGKRFKQPIDLKYHYMRHTGALPFKCDQCDSAYPLASELTKHKARKHSTLIDQDGMLIGKEDDSQTTLDDELAVFY
uniref:C2H2-type domain-containing protein n=1 Tax=Plectus sambesii TaxID=2011161 RepID=A0A914UV84_9BILA